MASTMTNDDHLEQTEHAQCVHLHRPRIERSRFDVKDHKEHRDQIEAYREAPGNVGGRFDAALIGFLFLWVRFCTPEEPRKEGKEQRGSKCDAQIDRNRSIRIHGL